MQFSISIVAAFIAWIAVFTIGVHIPSGPYVERMSNPISVVDWVMANLAIMFVYTRANFGWLCLISAYIGSKSGNSQISFMRTITYGFMVYQLALAGLLMFAKGDLGLPTQEQYISYASLSSILSFLVTYNPSLFESFVQTVASGFIGTKSKAVCPSCNKELDEN